MSSPIWQLIGPTRARLKKCLEGAATLLSTDAKEMTSEDNKFRIEVVIARITNSISILEQCNSDWSNVLKDLKDEQKTKEEKELHKMADGSDGYIELILDAGEYVAHLQTKLKIIWREQEKEHTVPRLLVMLIKQV